MATELSKKEILLRPAGIGHETITISVCNRIVNGWCKALRLELRQEEAAPDPADVSVDRDCAVLIQGEQADAVREFRADAIERRESAMCLCIGCVAQMFQPAFPLFAQLLCQRNHSGRTITPEGR